MEQKTQNKNILSACLKMRWSGDVRFYTWRQKKGEREGRKKQGKKLGEREREKRERQRIGQIQKISLKG